MSGNQYGSDNMLPKAKEQREKLTESLRELGREVADSTSETPLTDAVTTGSTGDLDFIYDLTFLCRQLERKLAQAKKRLIDAEEILGELASGYWRQTLNNIDDRPTRPDWPMGELIQLYWEKQNQGEQP